MRQVTKKEAIAIAGSKLYVDWSYDEKVKFQLFQKRLAMPFGVFHEAIEKVLKRPVYTHEFANTERLQNEYLGELPAPTFDEIISMIPEEKLFLVNI